MFWRFGGYTNISTLDNVLDKPDVTVEELLDESDLIQELKQQNSKLIEFLREEAVLKKLLDYVVDDRPGPVQPPETIFEEDDDSQENADKGKEIEKTDRPGRPERSSGKISFFGRSRSRSQSTNKRESDSDEEKSETRRKKYAYVACEVLSSEIWSITEAMLEYRDHLRDFWEYLRRPAPLDPVQAGYFTKVNDTLLDKKTEDMFNFLKSLEGIVPEMLKHVDCPMVMDLLLKMISLENADGGAGIVDWLQGQGLIPILLSYLGPGNSAATQTSAGDFLKAIITISANATGQDQTVIGPNELTRQLVSKKCITQLIDDMLTGGNPLTVGVGIVIEVIRKNNSDYDLDNQVGPEPRTSDPIFLGTLLREFAKHVPDFMHLVRDQSATRPQLKAAFGDTIEPLGFDRFKTCELMAELLHCSNMGLLNERGSEAEMLARDAEREKLKAEGRLTPAPVANSELEEPFASSVDSHGFHHARAPGDDLGESPERVNRLEVQNASDEDGFENVVVSDAEALPEEVSFDEIDEKTEESTLPPPPPLPLKVTRDAEKQDLEEVGIEDVPLDGEQDDGQATPPREKRRISLLTQQIQDQIDQTESPEQIEINEGDGGKYAAKGDTPEKPAPLFSSKSPSKGVDPILGGESPVEDLEPGTHSTATLQPENAEQAAAQRDQYPYEVDVDGQPVVGDYLKIQFVEHQVVPTILDFFFRFPWNNFLHNVVYDIVQQVFNGTLERGYNRTMAQDLFCESKCMTLVSRDEVITRILAGQAASDASQSAKGMRLGYMGHLTLIAEEVCKFAERHPPELLGETVMRRVTTPEWVAYVEGTLSDTRDRDNAVLGGVRPEQNMGIRSLAGGGMLGQAGGFGNSAALANAGLGVPSDSMALHDEGEYEAAAGGAGLLSGFGEGDDEDEMERERRRPVDDDEQPTSALSTSPSDTGSDAQQTPSIVPPLNIPPSRARRQLAARLAARRREAAAAELATSDPDAMDDLAIATASELPEEPLGNESAMLPPLRPPQRVQGRTVYARSSFDSEDSSSSGLDSSDEEERRGLGLGDAEEADEEEEDSEEEEEVQIGRRFSGEARRGSDLGAGGRRRRPSTTEAKVRKPIEDDDEESAEDQGSSDDEGDGSSDEDVVEIRTRRTS